MVNTSFKNKYFCLTCHKSFKGNQMPSNCPSCHSDTVMPISYRSRAPKVNASKKKWKEFFYEIRYSMKWYYLNKDVKGEQDGTN